MSFRKCLLIDWLEQEGSVGTSGLPHPVDSLCHHFAKV